MSNDDIVAQLAAHVTRVRDDLIRCLREMGVKARREPGRGAYVVRFDHPTDPFQGWLRRGDLRRPLPGTSAICDLVSQRLPYRPSAWVVTCAIRAIAFQGMRRRRSRAVPVPR